MRILAVLLVIAVLIAAGGYFAYNFLINLQPPELVEIRSGWGEVTHETSEVHTKIVINNPNRISISIGNLVLNYTIKMNGIPVAEGYKKGIKINHGLNVVELTTIINNSIIPEWFKTHVENGEETKIEIIPEVSVDLKFLKLTPNIPEFSHILKTNLLSSLNSREKIVVGSGGVTLIEIRERRASWGKVIDNEVPLDISLLLYNPNLIPITIPRIEFNVRMNDIEMIVGESTDYIVLEPKKEKEIRLTAYLNSENLDDWWVSHINNGEFTEINAEIEMMFNIGSKELPMRVLDCVSILKTDILNPTGITESSKPECSPPKEVVK